MGAFFSLTDISFEEFGEGSFDKGFYFGFLLRFSLQNIQKETLDGVLDQLLETELNHLFMVSRFGE